VPAHLGVLRAQSLDPCKPRPSFMHHPTPYTPCTHTPNVHITLFSPLILLLQPVVSAIAHTATDCTFACADSQCCTRFSSAPFSCPCAPCAAMQQLARLTHAPHSCQHAHATWACVLHPDPCFLLAPRSRSAAPECSAMPRTGKFKSTAYAQYVSALSFPPVKAFSLHPFYPSPSSPPRLPWPTHRGCRHVPQAAGLCGLFLPAPVCT